MRKQKQEKPIDDILKLTQLKNFMKGEVVDALKKPEGRKILCLDRSVVSGVMSVLDSFDLRATLQPFGYVDLQHLTHERLKANVESPKTVVYVVRADVSTVKLLGRRIKDDVAAHRNTYIHMVPKTTEACLRILEEYQVLRHVKEVKMLELDLIPLESDFLTMDLDSCFPEVVLDGDTTSLGHVARALMKFQAFFGPFPSVRGKGQSSEKIATMLQRMAAEVRDAGSVAPEVDALYIFDREVDVLTPMLTQQVYEGMIDECYGIRNQLFTPPFDVSAEDKSLNGKTLALTAEKDPVFAKLRGSHWTTVGPGIQTEVLRIKQMMESKNTMDSTELVQFVRKDLENLAESKTKATVHLSIIAEVLKIAKHRDFQILLDHEKNMIDGKNEKEALEYIEECIYKDEPLPKVLRLLSIASLTLGLSSAKFTSFKQQLVQNYGVQVLLTLDNLERAQFITPGGKRSFAFSSVSRSLRLRIEGVLEEGKEEKSAVKDISYSYGGWAPPLVRLAEMAITGKLQWNAMETAFNQFPGPTFGTADDSDEPVAGQNRVVMLFFVGGITHGELASLRSLKELAKQRYAEEGFETTFLVATTKIINGTNFVEKMYGALR